MGWTRRDEEQPTPQRQTRKWRSLNAGPYGSNDYHDTNMTSTFADAISKVSFWFDSSTFEGFKNIFLYLNLSGCVYDGSWRWNFVVINLADECSLLMLSSFAFILLKYTQLLGIIDFVFLYIKGGSNPVSKWLFHSNSTFNKVSSCLSGYPCMDQRWKTSTTLERPKI